MSYYRLLGLACEPFSTSPDPAFLYLSPIHRAALFRLRIAIELKRGLSLVIGDIGTGKTTLARKLSQIFYEDARFDFHVILNPMHHHKDEFLKILTTIFHLGMEEESINPVECLHGLEKYLFQKGVEEGKTVVLLVDEAQQLSRQALEILRALLNYETNEHKLLQVILFGQVELGTKLLETPNFWDRICLKLSIPPLHERQTFEMIEYRLTQARYHGRHPLFTADAVSEIYRKTQGYPRRITMLCHDALEFCVMTDRKQVDRRVIREVTKQQNELIEAIK